MQLSGGVRTPLHELLDRYEGLVTVSTEDESW